MNRTFNSRDIGHIDFNDVPRETKEKRITRLVRFSNKSHSRIKRLAKVRKTTMSKTLDHIIKKYFKHQRLYELD